MNTISMTSSKRPWTAAALVVAGFALLYRQVIVKLVHDWCHDDNYSHGFLIVPLALYFAWERREQLRQLPVAPDVARAGRRGRQPACSCSPALLGVRAVPDAHLDPRRARRRRRCSCSAGSICARWRFPLAFLLLMIPIPAIIFNQIAFPLQLLASRVRRVGDAGSPTSRCCAKATS